MLNDKHPWFVLEKVPDGVRAQGPDFAQFIWSVVALRHYTGESYCRIGGVNLHGPQLG
jgi:hypothetical protein